MNFSLKPHQLVAHWVPGFIALAIVFIADFEGRKHLIELSRAIGNSSTTLAIAVFPFAIGQFFDAIRNITEEVIYKCFRKCRINWEFIWKSTPDDLQRMEDYYFIYYVFDFNMFLALFLGALATWILPVFPQRLPCWMLILILVASVIFVIDCCFLRKEIVDKSEDLTASK